MLTQFQRRRVGARDDLGKFRRKFRKIQVQWLSTSIISG